MSDIVLMGDERVAAIHVRECADPLVDASNVPELTWADDADDPEGRYRHLRAGLVDRLLVAQRLLPPGLRLLLVEGHRPYALQAFYFDRHRAGLQAADPGLTEQEAFLAASQFVSPPQVAPHVSGAAIDLTLVDGSGAVLDMGTPIDASPEESAGACYFAASNIGDEARGHRETLSSALTAAGLVNYPTEWWHWSYGDRYWALVTGAAAAIYGPVDQVPPSARTDP